MRAVPLDHVLTSNIIMIAFCSLQRTNFRCFCSWYDKTVQLVIGSDGNCGLCYEHSASEGIAVIALIEHLLKYV